MLTRVSTNSLLLLSSTVRNFILSRSPFYFYIVELSVLKMFKGRKRIEFYGLAVSSSAQGYGVSLSRGVFTTNQSICFTMKGVMFDERQKNN